MTAIAVTIVINSKREKVLSLKERMLLYRLYGFPHSAKSFPPNNRFS
jgi:hypothetical protein